MPALDWQGVLTGQPLQWILSGFLTTLWVTLAGIALASLLALLFMLLRLSGGRVGKAIVGAKRERAIDDQRDAGGHVRRGRRERRRRLGRPLDQDLHVAGRLVHVAPADEPASPLSLPARISFSPCTISLSMAMALRILS